MTYYLQTTAEGSMMISTSVEKTSGKYCIKKVLTPARFTVKFHLSLRISFRAISPSVRPFPIAVDRNRRIQPIRKTL